MHDVERSTPMLKPQLRSAISRELNRLNPWVHNTGVPNTADGVDLGQVARAVYSDLGPLSEKVAFEQALATRSRWRMGVKAWNIWAREMVHVASEAEGDLASRAICAALAKVNFSGMRLAERADFAGFMFPGEADFSGAEIESSAWFQASKFQAKASFANARFKQIASLNGAEFAGAADFTRSYWSETTEFRDCRFKADARFEDAMFCGAAWFADAKFERVSFRNAEFIQAAGFSGAHFQADADISGACFRESFSFERCRFDRLVDFRSIVTQGSAWFRSAEFKFPPKADDAHVLEVLSGAGSR